MGSKTEEYVIKKTRNFKLSRIQDLPYCCSLVFATVIADHNRNNDKTKLFSFLFLRTQVYMDRHGHNNDVTVLFLENTLIVSLLKI